MFFFLLKLELSSKMTKKTSKKRKVENIKINTARKKKKEDNNNSILSEIFPDDIWNIIFDFTDTKTLFRLQISSKYFLQLILKKPEQFWKKRYESQFKLVSWCEIDTKRKSPFYVDGKNPTIASLLSFRMRYEQVASNKNNFDKSRPIELIALQKSENEYFIVGCNGRISCIRVRLASDKYLRYTIHVLKGKEWKLFYGIFANYQIEENIGHYFPVSLEWASSMLSVDVSKKLIRARCTEKNYSDVAKSEKELNDLELLQYCVWCLSALCTEYLVRNDYDYANTTRFSLKIPNYEY